MKRTLAFAVILSVLVQGCRNTDPAEYKVVLGEALKESVLEDGDYYIWGASPVRSEDGKYHLFYSRWKKAYGFASWLTRSEIAHAVSENALGPYIFSDVALPERGAELWDGLNTHNPTIHFWRGKYYLYYTGNTGDGIIDKENLNFSHRNNQRIGVAVAESPYGPWKRFDRPLIDVSSDSTAWDALMTSNPSVTETPEGKYLMVYKAVAKKKAGVFGGPVVHLCAIADNPEGPFIKHGEPIFTSEDAFFPAEDPYIWYQDGSYHAIVKDMQGIFTHSGKSLALFYSIDGFDWKQADSPLVSVPEIRWTDGSVTKLYNLERPQLLFENGNPVALFLAANAEENLYKSTRTFNVHIPLY